MINLEPEWSANMIMVQRTQIASLRAENERLKEFNSKGCQDDTQQCQYLHEIEKLRAENRELREAKAALKGEG